MTIGELVSAIAKKHANNDFGLHPPLSTAEISAFEEQIGFILPQEFRTFYTICSGFETNEDIFRMIPVKEIIGEQNITKGIKFTFAEYMIYSEIWTLKYIEENDYEIANDAIYETVLTSSLTEFLEHYLAGNIFEPGGLAEWQEQIKPFRR